ncbi:hypothetical protein A0130_00280 [Leifsonia xyli]|uniref:hypothetical protein n=1 Tax=Leifsonia xyli TaxID=1575 RepID=UPI0007CE09FF|nr:hypothetical protein A0130_00280 [Leifsonia xyli]
MRRIVYAGTAFYTGDMLAEALLEYARALGQQGIADTVFVPGRTIQGEFDHVEVLIGPASQIVSEPVELIGPELQDPQLVDRLRALTAQLAPRRPEAEPADGADGATGTDGRPAFDDL